MKTLIASILTLAVLIGSFGVFYDYSNRQLGNMEAVCQEKILPAITEKHWQEAESTFHQQYNRWHAYRKKALFFLDTDEISEIDQTFSKTQMYISAKDISNSSGELLALQSQLRFLHESQAVYLQNIL